MTAADVPGERVEALVVADARPDGSDHDHPWSWHASRASALLLVVLVPLHFAVTFLREDVGATTARSISARLDDPTWRLLTWLTIVLALVHGTLAAESGIRRRLPGGGGLALTAVLCVFAGAGLAAASWVLATRWV